MGSCHKAVCHRLLFTDVTATKTNQTSSKLSQNQRDTAKTNQTKMMAVISGLIHFWKLMRNCEPVFFDFCNRVSLGGSLGSETEGSQQRKNWTEIQAIQVPFASKGFFGPRVPVMAPLPASPVGVGGGWQSPPPQPPCPQVLLWTP